MSVEIEADDIGYDPFDVKVMSDPHPYYRRLRRERPVYYTPQYDTYWLSRFQDIVQMLSLVGKLDPDAGGAAAAPRGRAAEGLPEPDVADDPAAQPDL